MSWRDRDWAKLTEDEVSAIYGGGRPAALPAASVVPKRTAGLAVAVAISAVGTLVGVTHPWHVRTSVGAVPPPPIYGIAVTFAGAPGTCVAAAFNTATQHWICTSIRQNTDRTAPVTLHAAPYPGPCAEIEDDQSSGRWRCDNPQPVDPATLPAGPIVG
jgi:hypothetical protein